MKVRALSQKNEALNGKESNGMKIANIHSEPLKPEWCDYYGHLNEAFYLLVFSNATFELQNILGIGEDYYNRTGRSLYTLESHIRYLQEVRGKVIMSVDSIVLGVDQKRIRVGHVMKVDNIERATAECMLLHFDVKLERAVTIPEDILSRLKKLKVADAPEWAGRSIRDIGH